MSKHSPVTELRARITRRPSRYDRGRLRALLASILLAMATFAVSAPTAGAQTATEERRCDTGVFCAWTKPNFEGKRHSFDLRNTNMESCVPLRARFEARSFMNRIDRPVTVYQDARCSTTGDFSTYPAGSQAPRSRYVVRAVKIWTH